MRKFSLFLLFALSLLVAAAGYGLVVMKQQAQVEALTFAHERVVSGFSASYWKADRGALLPLVKSGSPEVADSVELAVAVADLTSYLQGMGFVASYLHAPDGKVLAATGQGSVTAPDAMQVRQAVMAGRGKSFLVKNNAGETLVITVVPVMKDSEAEIAISLASALPSGMMFAWMIAGFVAVAGAALLVMYLVGHWSVQRAENLIARQYEENAELVAKAAMANEENQQKSQFLANITHELRTPLNAIIGFSDILKNEFIPGPGQSSHTNYINDIHSAGTHLLSLINDILDYSKAEAGKLELEITEVNAVRIIQNCMRLVQPRAEMGQVKLAESLPKEPIELMTDTKKFKQVLLNLLSNAVKFTPAGGTVSVHAWHDLRPDEWVFEVTDTGIGMAQKDIPKALAPFGQVDNALSRKFEGTGLGLPLTKKFVELMGGRFDIQSEPGKGTKVTFSLPREYRPVKGVVAKQVA